MSPWGEKEPQPGLSLSLIFTCSFSFQSLSFSEKAGEGFPITLYAKFAPYLLEVFDFLI